jgi:hypothetical protein
MIGLGMAPVGEAAASARREARPTGRICGAVHIVGRANIGRAKTSASSVEPLLLSRALNKMLLTHGHGKTSLICNRFCFLRILVERFF